MTGREQGGWLSPEEILPLINPSLITSYKQSKTNGEWEGSFLNFMNKNVYSSPNKIIMFLYSIILLLYKPDFFFIIENIMCRGKQTCLMLFL